MKYQVYLNKNASEAINSMANKEGIKPCQLIKAMIEGMIDTFNGINKGTININLSIGDKDTDN